MWRRRAFFLDDLRKVAQTNTAMLQSISAAPKLGIENATPAPSTSSHSAVVVGLIDQSRGTRSVYASFLASSSTMAAAAFLIAS